MNAFHPDKPNPISDLQSGDPVAFGRFVRNHQDTVFGFLGRMGFSQTDAEDLAQETFLRVWHHRESYQAERAKISTWLCTIARNVALNEIDKRSRRPVQKTTNIESIISTDPTANPESRLASNQKIEQLNTVLHLLPVEDRTAIALYFVEGLSSADASQVMGCSEGAFRTRLSRARVKLLKLWQTQQLSNNQIQAENHYD